MKNLSKLIDHTLLKPDANKKDIENLCNEAIKYSFKSVCINPIYVSLCRDILRNSDVNITTVIGFPLASNRTEVKALEAKLAVEDGADEIDMVINIPALKNKEYDLVKKDIGSVIDSVKKDTIVKVIIETCYLTEEEKVKACEIILESGADYVKTSTGYGKYGVTGEDIKIIKSIVGSNLGIKASGGINDIEVASEMIGLGATRIGTSSGIKILTEL